MTLKTSFQYLKKKFATLFLLELFFLFSTLFFLVYVKNKLQNYLALIAQRTPELAALQEAAEKNALDAAQAVGTLGSFETMTNNALLFSYLVVPLVLFVLWCAFQSLLWFSLKGNVKSFKAFFCKFSSVTAVIALLAFAVFRSLMQEVLSFTLPEDTIAKFLLFSFIFFYFLTIYYLCLNNEPLTKTLKRTFFLACKKAHKIIFPLLLLFIVTLATLFLFFTLFTSYTTGNFFLLSPVPLVLYFLVCTGVALLLKVFLQVKVNALE